MANPTLENGYTKIANEIMDTLCRTRIAGEERQILDCILRKTYGWNKCEDSISLSQFVEMTGIKKPNVVRSIKALLSKKIITVIKKDNRTSEVYKFNNDFDTWIPLSKKITLSKKIMTVIKKDNASLSKKIPTKETTTKETITKEKIHMSVSKKTDSCPHQEIINLYHELLPEMPRVAKWTDKRKSNLKTCWADKSRQNMEWWRKYFDDSVRPSDFLMGRADVKFMCNLEWLTRESNLVKVLEGNYKNRAKEVTSGINKGNNIWSSSHQPSKRIDDGDQW